MFRISLKHPNSLDEFRHAARGLIAADAPPENVIWSVEADGDLFAAQSPEGKARPVIVPAAFARLAENVICHRDPERFPLLYTLLWRITQGERTLLAIASDPLVHRLARMAKSVGRDLHKMTAFVRFRRVEADDGEQFIAWFEPEHHILHKAAKFFVARFASMRWSILTPGGAIHWNGKEVSFGPGVSRSEAPAEDGLEEWWRTYYRSIFNPARANPEAMRAEMPKKYWRNMPETSLIPDLLAASGRRTQAMIEATPTAPRRAAPPPIAAPAVVPAGSLAELKAEAAVCTRCPLFRDATQTVFGEGPLDAPVVFVGEQPGDQEDLAGRPFTGPAGQMFDRALGEACVDRSRVYVTNAVKHFKYEPRGKRRIHKRPNANEIEHCRWWLTRELDLVKPQLTVALGATAARALTGRDVTISRERGRILSLADGRTGFITVHPSFLLRLPDAGAQATEYARFVDDLRAVGRHLPEIRKAA